MERVIGQGYASFAEFHRSVLIFCWLHSLSLSVSANPNSAAGVCPVYTVSLLKLIYDSQFHLWVKCSKLWTTKQIAGIIWTAKTQFSVKFSIPSNLISLPRIWPVISWGLENGFFNDRIMRLAGRNNFIVMRFNLEDFYFTGRLLRN